MMFGCMIRKHSQSIAHRDIFQYSVYPLNSNNVIAPLRHQATPKGKINNLHFVGHQTETLVLFIFLAATNLFDYVPIIVSSCNFQELLPVTKGQGQRSKVKVTEVTTQLNRFRTVTPV